MIGIDGGTIGEAFDKAVARWPDAPFLIEPAASGGPPRIVSYKAAAEAVRGYADTLSAAGYGHGHRIAMLIGNRAEFFLMKLAMNRLGISNVPVNPDYRAGELAYLLDDSRADLALVERERLDLMEAGIAEAGRNPPLALLEEIAAGVPRAAAPPPAEGAPTPATEASLIYTSGTTGRPKGCILSHEAELMYGESYLMIPEPFALREAADRALNPLPLFHVNAGVITFFGMMLSGNAQIIPTRFSASTWWRDIRDTGATIFHYLGVVISVLMAGREAGKTDTGALRWALGAGVEPALHGAFESRFGVPLVECWGMTEMCRVLFVAEEPRMIDTRAIGRPRDGLEVRVADREGRDVPPGTPGEMLLRHSAEKPRKGFFSGYLNKPEATAEAWRDGWFHTGDTVTQDKSGMIFFVDRAKNIIRRAGENIAAAEVENCLFEDKRVAAVACIAAPDKMREEEVLACIVLAEGVEPNEETARALFDHAFQRLAYFKPPGWIRFLDALPVTGTQKVVKHQIFASGEDPRADAFDFRDLKRRA
ncbi:ATP-dependent acyl-CoA ligase [Pikeienuella piscinae]|uniref:ATP-dependent acyl-CoA ligase n=1 Tax=Pikeienuella piscinae TaxID=2748098 RepID=A0A7L5BYC1_9RHOB|nr:AMP-binding protein [Pikeienuella piscinae]QIE55517.1 ATP-dependent acyl-CoA ligase [Pikeienuella piscinae]